MMGSWCLCLVLHVLFVSLVINALVEESPHTHTRSKLQRAKNRSPSRRQLGSGDYPCGEGYCRCNGTFADCSGHFGNLTFVPHLPETIDKLKFVDNDIKRIGADFFHNVTNITWLDIRHNRLAEINPDALRCLEHLEYLDLSVNHLREISPETLASLIHLEHLNLSGNRLTEISPAALRPLVHLKHLRLSLNMLTEISAEVLSPLKQLEYLSLSYNRLTAFSSAALLPLNRLQYLYLSGNSNMTLAPVFSVATLRVLFVANCALGPLPVGLTPTHFKSQLEELYMSGNRIFPFNMTVLAPLVNLKLLDVGRNNIQSDELVTAYLPQLNELRLDNNALDSLPETCEHGVSLFPNLRTMRLINNLLDTLPEKICLPRLEVFYLSQNRFLQINTNAFSQQRFPVLRQLDLDRMDSLSMIDNNAFSNSRLEMLRLRDDTDSLLAVDFYPDSFAGCENLRHLDLSGTEQDYTRFYRVFGNLTKLEYLSLAKTELEHINLRTFRNFGSLIELDLNDNKLSNLPAGAFDALTNLTKLFLHNNKISSVSPDTFGADTRKQLRELDISSNPFFCSCDVMWFRKWLKTKPSVFVNVVDQRKYMCANIPDTSVQSFYLPGQACLLSREASSSIISTTAILIFTMTLALLLYSYRWHLRLVLYEAFRGRGERWRRLQEGHFLYDVFVSYDSEDLDWVLAHLVPELEERMGLKLCLHQRDFIPGKHIVDNISDCVEASKKVLMLFSTSFAQSQWCQFELNFCLRHVLDYDDALVVVMLHDVPSRDLTTAMMAVMKTTTYIEWDDTPDARASFWGRLQIAFHEIMHCGQNENEAQV